MRDKVLCRGWGDVRAPNGNDVFLLRKREFFSVLLNFSFFLIPHISVPVSIQGGVKMSIDEFMSFLDRNTAWVDLKAERFLEKHPGKGLDTIFAAESLFKGSVVDFGDLSSHSGGGNYASNGFAIN